MAKATKPKTKTPKTKTPKGDEPKRRNVKKDTVQIIETALLCYSASRAAVDMIMESPTLTEAPSSEIAVALKRIRDAQHKLQAAHATISAMRDTPWRERMMSHIHQWDSKLDATWDAIIEQLS